MIPNKKDQIKTMDDVEREYPKYFNLRYLKDPLVKRFIKEEFDKQIKEEKGRCKFNSVTLPYENKLKAMFTALAEAKGLYIFFWHTEHITSQMLSWGWNPKDAGILVKRMKAAGYNPWSITEDTAGEYIDKLPGHGFAEVSIDGDTSTFIAYDPEGKHRNSKKSNHLESNNADSQILS